MLCYNMVRFHLGFCNFDLEHYLYRIADIMMILGVTSFNYFIQYEDAELSDEHLLMTC